MHSHSRWRSPATLVAGQKSISLTLLGTYASGIYDEGGAEIVAHDPKTQLTFSPNGRWLLVANEGEPNDEYTIDPEGSVSIIDMRRGASGLRQSDVRTAGFVAFNAPPNGVKLDPSIRIFGPGATVAQDIEPEYLTVSNDSRTAWVTCQENNALASSTSLPPS